MAKTFDEVVYSLCKQYTDQSQLGFKSVKQLANGFEIEYVNGTKATYTVQNMHKHDNMPILSKFSLSADGKLLYDGKPIEGAGGTGEAYDDTVLRGLINTNKTNIATNASDIVDLNTKIGSSSMDTTATDITGAVAEVNGNLLDTVSFSADYKNIVLNRKNGLNPYAIPISAIINHAKLIELADVDVTDIGNGKTLVYDATTQKHKYVSSSGTDEFVKMEASTDAHYLADLIDKQTVVNDNGVLKVKKLDGQEVTIAEINYLKGLTMNVMELVNAFANGGVKVINTPLNTASELDTMDRSSFIDGISYIVYVLADETHAGAKTTYLVDKTNTTFFGNADSQRNFTTDPIDLANEVTGKLGTNNIDVDALWALLTVDDTYKTLTTTDNVFGTHGAKNMYDELTTAIGAKANATDLTTHTDNTDIHITTAERTKWDKVTNKVDKTDFDTHKNDTNVHITSAERTKWNGKEDSSNKTTTIDSTSTDTKYPSAKAVYDNAIKDKNLNTYSDVTQLGLTIPTTVGEIFNALPNFSLLRFQVDNHSVTDAPLANGILIIDKIRSAKFTIEFKCSADGYIAENNLYIGQIKGSDGSELTWKRLCTTSVADTSGTVTLPDGLVGNIDYKVINGICYVSVQRLADGLTGGQVPTFTGLPKASTYVNVGIESSGYRVGSIYSDDGVTFHVHKISDVGGYCSFSYPVAES